jgi:hypothetical protein
MTAPKVHIYNSPCVKMHTNKHTNIQSEEQNETISSVALSETPTNEHDKVFKCLIFNFKSSSENGIKIHTTKKHSHFCHFCKQYLSNAVELKSHTFDCGRKFYALPLMSPVRNTGQFSPRFPPRFPSRFPPRFPLNALW